MEENLRGADSAPPGLDGVKIIRGFFLNKVPGDPKKVDFDRVFDRLFI